MKKFFAIILALMFIIPLTIYPTSAIRSTDELSIERSIEFQNSDFEDKTQEEIFEEKMCLCRM